MALANPSDRSSGHPTSLSNISVTPTRYPRPRLRHNHQHNISNKKRTHHYYGHKRGNSISLSRQRDYSSESELKMIEENIVSWGTIAAVQASMNHNRHGDVKFNYHYGENDQVGAEFKMHRHNSDCLDDDLKFTKSVSATGAIPNNNKIGLSRLGCTRARQHRVSRYIQCLSQHHHGSLDRKYIGDVSLLYAESDDDNVFHPSLSTRFLVNL